MELEDFKCCRKCERIETCQAPCHKFLNAAEMKCLDKKVFDHSGLEINPEKAKKEAELKFKSAREKVLSKAKLNKKMTFIVKKWRDEEVDTGKVTQITDAFIVLKCLKYIKTINFRDVLTKDVVILNA